MDFTDERERLIAEQAVLAYRAVREAGDKAAWGHGMEALEDAVMEEGRKTQRRMLEEAMEAASQKPTPTAAALGAGAGPSSSGSVAGG